MNFNFRFLDGTTRYGVLRLLSGSEIELLVLGVPAGLLFIDRIGESTGSTCIGTFILVSHRRLDSSLVSMHFSLATCPRYNKAED